MPLRPRSPHSWHGRIYTVANSPDSVAACARAGAQMLLFGEKHWEARLPALETYRSQYQELWGVAPPGPLTVDLVFCDPDPDQLLEHFKTRRDIVGPYELAVSFRFGGIPAELSESAMKLFASEVLPELKSW